MTEEEALDSLCAKAANNEISFFTQGDPIGPVVVVFDGGPYDEYRRLFGGKIGIRGRDFAEVWVTGREQATELIRKLLPRPAFKNSGKHYYAAEVLAKATGVPITEIVRRRA